MPKDVDELPRLPFSFAAHVASLAIAGATVWMGMQAQVDSAKADISYMRIDVEGIKKDRAESLKIWRQDRIDDAAFRAEVITKLRNIEKKVSD